jgi:hypothetical protein
MNHPLQMKPFARFIEDHFSVKDQQGGQEDDSRAH